MVDPVPIPVKKINPPGIISSKGIPCQPEVTAITVPPIINPPPITAELSAMIKLQIEMRSNPFSSILISLLEIIIPFYIKLNLNFKLISSKENKKKLIFLPLMRFKVKGVYAFFSLMLFFEIFSCGIKLEAGFSNNGRFQSNCLNLTVNGTLDNNGQLIGLESAYISCHTLSGNGLILSPSITIQAELFAFTGTIECSGKCVIITRVPFNENMFGRRGGGEFVIIVDENLGKNFPKFSADYFVISDELLAQIN